MVQVLETLKKYKNLIFFILGLIIAGGIAIWIVSISSDNFNLKKENKEYKKTISEFDSQLKVISFERDSFKNEAEYNKYLSDSLIAIQNKTHNQTTKIIYETNKQMDNIVTLDRDSSISLWSKLSEEYMGYYLHKDSL